MFDIGWQELFVVAILALIIVGPKDLPRAIRTATAWIRKARKLGREFQAGVSEMVREAELEDVKKQLADGKNIGANLGDELSRSLDFAKDFAEDEDKTILPPDEAPGEVIDVVAQDVVTVIPEDETVMPVLDGKTAPAAVSADEQPVISLDDDVMPVLTKNSKTEPPK